MIEVLTAGTRRRMAWNNGHGWTTELARDPSEPVAEREWGWRISVAEIAVDAPFSHFPGIDRSLMVLTGAGVRLSFDGRSHELTPADPAVAFAGELPVDCVLLAGPTRDFNVMTRRGVWTHAVERREITGRLDAAPPPGGLTLVHVVAGSLSWDGSPLAAGDSVLADEAAELVGFGTVVVAALQRRHPGQHQQGAGHRPA